MGHAPGEGDADREAVEAEDAPGLGAMRAVWLSMRDEAPPERGLSELLAAARRKAEAMQPEPTRWQRLLGVLRRPAVLALATAMVLIGVGAILGRRVGEPRSNLSDAAGEMGGLRGAVPDDPGDRARVPAGRAPDAVRTTPGAAAGAAERPSAAPGVLRSPGAGVSVEPAELGSAAGQEVVPAAAAHAARPTRASVEPPAPLRKETAGRRPAAPLVARAPTEPRAPRAKGDLVGNDGARHREETTPAEAEPALVADVRAADRGAGDGASGSAENARAASPRAQPPRAASAQLYEQCESAARRGDCAAVRRLVDEISRTDRAYRARLAKESVMARCLAE